MGFFVFVSVILFSQILQRKPNKFWHNMKVKPRHTLSRFKMRVMYPFLFATLLAMTSCDFDIPKKFEMPTWYLDLKIPLLQTRLPMTDLVDSLTIFPKDSLGFQIIQSGAMEPTELPALPSIPVGLDQSISSGEIPGVSLNIPLALPDPIEQTIRVDIPGFTYLDTTDTKVGGVTVSDYTTFTFPNAETVVMDSQSYNTTIVAPFNTVIEGIFSALATEIEIGLSSIEPPSDPPIIASIDTLIIATDEINSIYRTLFRNNNIPTNLQEVYSYLVTGNSPPLLDSLANHNKIPSLSNGQTYADTTALSGKGLTNFLKIASNLSLQKATTEYITIPPIDSMWVDFHFLFSIPGIGAIDITTNNYSMSDGIEMPDMSLPEMDMSESGITKMEIYRNIVKSVEDGALNFENKLIIENLASTFPFDLKFLLDFQNFFPPNSNELVRIDTILKAGVEINKTFNLAGDTLQSIIPDNNNDGWPDSAFTSFDLILDITVPIQKATIPLDGTPLGEFTMNMNLQQLSFSEIGANMFMEMPADETSQEFPPGFTGAIPTEAEFNLIFKNQIQLPIQMSMQFKGYNSLGELTYVPVNIDTMGLPATSNDLDTAVTVISLNKLGTTISIFNEIELYNSYLLNPLEASPSFSKTEVPCDTCASIIDLLASNPVQLVIVPEVKIDGRGSITANKAIAGGFEVKIPFILQIAPMAFLGGTATEIEPFDHQTRYKIRNSLLETSLVSTITNAMPFGAEVSVLMSNIEFFPTDTSREQLNFFRDTLVSQGKLLLGDSLYILRKCSEISPDSSNVYIFNVMTDFSDCINGLPYLVKSNGSMTDTLFSYVDTLFKFTLPDPESYYGANDTSGYPQGMVAIPGTGIYPSTIDTSQIYLLTDYGSHFTMPRFYLPGTGNKSVFLSKDDYLDISSFITFTLSSSGAFGSAGNELLIISPNGTETFFDDEEMNIKWVAMGTSDETVDLYYSTSTDSSTYRKSLDSCKQTSDWQSIASDLTSVTDTNSYSWPLSSLTFDDSLKIRIKAVYSNGEACDINGYYVNIRKRALVRSSSPFRKQKIIGVFR